MADFSIANIEGPSASPVTPVEPVQKSSGVSALGLVGSAFDLGERLYTANKKRKAAGVIAAFEATQLKLADAVDLGAISSKEARLKMRANYASFVANNPTLVSEFAASQKNIITTTGLGKIVAEGTPAEQAQAEINKKATLGGWVKPWMTPEEQEKASQDYVAFEKAKSDLLHDQAQLSYDTSKLTQEKTQIELENAKRKEASRVALAKFADAAYPRFSSDLDEIKSQVDAGRLSREDALLEMDRKWDEIQEVTTGVGAEGGSEYLTALTNPMKTKYESMKKFISGEISIQQLENQSKVNIAKRKLLITANPKMAQFVAVSQLLPNMPVSLTPDLNLRAIEMLKMGTEGTKVNPLDPDKDSVKNYLDVIKGNMEVMSKEGGTTSAEAKGELDKNILSILKGVKAYSLAYENPQDFNLIVDFFASNQFYEYTSKAGGVPVELAVQAKEVLQAEYESQVVPLLQRRYDSTVLSVEDKSRPITATPSPFMEPLTVSYEANTTPLPKVITPVFSGGAMYFKASKPEARQAADKLNKEVAPIVNRLIKMSAHLEGGKDYKKVFEDNYQAIFGLPQEGKTGNTDGTTDKVLSELSAKEGVGDKVTSVKTGELGVTEAARKAVGADEDTPDSEVARKYLTKLEGRWKGVEGYDSAPETLKEALLDTSYNMGEQVFGMNKTLSDLKSGEYDKVAEALLYTASVGGKSVRGVAVRRAEAYNKVAENDITEIEQKEDGTLVYKDSEGKELFSYKPKGGRHEKSKVGSIPVPTGNTGGM